MGDPVAARMTPEDMKRYESLRTEGYALLKAAHALYMQYVESKK